MRWSMCMINLPDLYVGKSTSTEKAASTGPLVMISLLRLRIKVND